jgi:DNA-binding ferritin-like protein (Dps family)
MRIFNSNFDKVNGIASKYIIAVKYKLNNVPTFKFATLSDDLINGSNKPELSSNAEYYTFYDLIKKEWFKFVRKDQLEFHYYGVDIANVETPNQLFLIEDKKLIKKINDDTKKLIKEKEILRKEFISKVNMYSKTCDKVLIETYYQLLSTETLSLGEALFSTIFNVTIDDYVNENIKDIDVFKNVFKKIVKDKEKKSLNEINKEAKLLPANEKKEIQSIKNMIINSVKDSFEKIKEINNPVTILEQYPIILQPSPDFIENDNGVCAYSSCKEKINEFLKE